MYFNIFMIVDKYILFLLIILSKLLSEQERDFILSFNRDHSFMIDFCVLVILASHMNTYHYIV